MQQMLNVPVLQRLSLLPAPLGSSFFLVMVLGPSPMGDQILNKDPSLKVIERTLEIM